VIKAVLFDLDGTLLPMDQDIFVETHMQGMCRKGELRGYEAKKLADSVWQGLAAMVSNPGETSNEEAFWNTFAEIHGEAARDDVPLFEDYYRNEFQLVREVCGFQPMSRALIDMLKARGLRLALATNPLFPAVATENRIRWAGLEPSDFELYTTYENSRFCKPNPDYYLEILEKLGCKPEECLMVGNDVGDDMIAPQKLGMKVFLLTDCLINRDNADISAYPQGSFDALMKYIRSL